MKISGNCTTAAERVLGIGCGKSHGLRRWLACSLSQAPSQPYINLRLPLIAAQLLVDIVHHLLALLGAFAQAHGHVLHQQVQHAGRSHG